MSTNFTEDGVAFGSCGIATYLRTMPTGAIGTVNIVIIAVDTFLAIFSVVTNSLFILTYHNSRELRNTANMLLVFLAISDILVGCLVLPLHIVRAVMENNGDHSCVLWNISRLVMIFCSGLSFLTIIVITHDRYFAIFYPLHYQVLFSKSRIKVVLTANGVPLVGLLLARIFLELRSFFLIICALTFYTTISALVVYIKILFVARKQKIQIENTESRLQSNRQLSNSLTEMKTTKVMACVLGAMILCYFPGTCFWIYGNYHGYTVESLYTVVPFLETALFMNSAINPVVYVLRSRKIRTAFLKSNFRRSWTS